MALSVSEANAVSTRHFDKGQITEQVYDNNVVLDKIKQKNRVIVSGGTSIQHTIRYQELGDADMIDPDAARVTSQKETRTALELDWKWAYPLVWLVMVLVGITMVLYFRRKKWL